VHQVVSRTLQPLLPLPQAAAAAAGAAAAAVTTLLLQPLLGLLMLWQRLLPLRRQHQLPDLCAAAVVGPRGVRWAGLGGPCNPLQCCYGVLRAGRAAAVTDARRSGCAAATEAGGRTGRRAGGQTGGRPAPAASRLPASPLESEGQCSVRRPPRTAGRQSE
jgi:hypothetical protein